MADRLKRKHYGSDLSDREWATIEPLLPQRVPRDWGKQPTWHLRDIVDGIFYVIKTGCQWREVPGDLPHWNSVWGYFLRWRKDGTWQRVHDALRGDLREAAGRDREPSAAIIDSQSVKGTEMTGVGSPGAQDESVVTEIDAAEAVAAILNSDPHLPPNVTLTQIANVVIGVGHGLSEDQIPEAIAEEIVGAEDRAPAGATRPKGARGASGYDAGKKVKGRKRHILVDTLGLIVAIVVHSANVQDRDGAKMVLRRAQRRPGGCPRLQKIWADGGYAGALIEWVQNTFGWNLEIVKRPDEAKGFTLLKWRWIVERTLGWFGRFQRLAKDYERYANTQETMVLLAMSRLMVRRLVHRQRESFRGCQVFAAAA